MKKSRKKRESAVASFSRSLAATFVVRAFTCATVHEPRVRALMANRAIDELDALDILARQFAKQGRGFSKTA